MAYRQLTKFVDFIILANRKKQRTDAFAAFNDVTGEDNYDRTRKIAYVKAFIDNLANGINPIDAQPVAEYGVVNNVRLTRCFCYVSDILRQVIENGGTTLPKKKAMCRHHHKLGSSLLGREKMTKKQLQSYYWTST